MNQERLLDSKNCLDFLELSQWWQTIMTMTMAVILESVFPFNILIDNYILLQWDLLTKPIDVALTYITMALTLLNHDSLAFEWLFFPWLAFLDGSKSRKLLIIWLSYGIISGNLANSGTNFLNLNSLSQKATKMSKKPSMTILLWQSLISSVCVWYCETFFKEVPIGQTNDPFHVWGSERFSFKVTWIVCQTYYSWEE